MEAPSAAPPLGAERRRKLGPRRALGRVGWSALAGLAAALAAGRFLSAPVTALLGWNAASACLLVLVGLLIARADASATAERAAGEDPGRNAVYAVVVLTSMVSLLAAALLSRVAHQVAGREATLFATLTALTAALSWTLTHAAFTLRYAHLYYREDEEGVGGVEFPGTAAPSYGDFAYLAFTVGMCFQVSDVQVSSSQIRRAVLLQGVISFAYNTVILALVLNLIFGMGAAPA